MVLHLQHADDPPRPDPLARFFAMAWRDFLTEQEWAGPDLQEAIVAAGLGEWVQDVDNGDPAVRLTDAGRAAIEVAKRAT